jgi:hypothetical protein
MGIWTGQLKLQGLFLSDSDNDDYILYNDMFQLNTRDDSKPALHIYRADYAQYENQAGLPVMGWNAGEVGFDYLADQQYENLL